MTIAPTSADLVSSDVYRDLQRRFQIHCAVGATVKPFDPDHWSEVAGPPNPEALAEMEEFLRELNEERERSLANKSGVGR